MITRVLVSAIIALAPACSSGPDASVQVEYDVHFSPPVTMSVTFKGPDGATLDQTLSQTPSRGDPLYTAQMPDGGTVILRETQTPGQPNAQYQRTYTVEGVVAGDHYFYGGYLNPDERPSLPSDCTCRSITTWTLDPGSGLATWTDPDSASVDARMVWRDFRTCSALPPFTCASPRSRLTAAGRRRSMRTT